MSRSARPLGLYRRPYTLYVAGFIGSPAMNMIKGRIRVNGTASFEGPAGVIFSLAAAGSGNDGRPAVYGVRPEHFSLSDDGAEAEVQVIEPTGSELQVVAKLGGEDIIAVFRERHQFKPGEKIRLKPDPRLVHLFDGRRGNASATRTTTGGTTMSNFTRRTLVKGGTAAMAAGALTGPALLEWAKAWAQSAPWKPEKDAKLSMLRWKYFVQSEDDAFVKLIEAFTKATGVKVDIARESYEDVQPKASVAANTGTGPDLFWGLYSLPHLSRKSAWMYLTSPTISARNTAVGSTAPSVWQERQQVDRDPDLLLG